MPGPEQSERSLEEGEQRASPPRVAVLIPCRTCMAPLSGLEARTKISRLYSGNGLYTASSARKRGMKRVLSRSSVPVAWSYVSAYVCIRVHICTLYACKDAGTSLRSDPLASAAAKNCRVLFRVVGEFSALYRQHIPCSVPRGRSCQVGSADLSFLFPPRLSGSRTD